MSQVSFIKVLDLRLLKKSIKKESDNVNKERITITTTTGKTTIAIDSICAYTFVASECVQIHLKSGTIFTTSDFESLSMLSKVVKDVEQ